jgi:hypothetical protein
MSTIWSVLIPRHYWLSVGNRSFQIYGFVMYVPTFPLCLNSPSTKPGPLLPTQTTPNIEFLPNHLRSDKHLEVIRSNKNHLSIMHINTQSMTSTFAALSLLTNSTMLLWAKHGWSIIPYYCNMCPFLVINSVITAEINQEGAIWAQMAGNNWKKQKQKSTPGCDLSFR